MRKICLPLFAAVLTLTAFAHADDWSKTYDLTGKPELRVEARDANVRIEAWDQDKIEAHVTTRGLAHRKRWAGNCGTSAGECGHH